MNDIVGCASPASRQLYQTLLNAVRAFGTFEEQRKNVWSGFLTKALRILAQMTEPAEEEEVQA